MASLHGVGVSFPFPSAPAKEQKSSILRPVTLVGLLAKIAWPVTIVCMFTFILVSAVYFNRTSSLSPTDDSLIGIRPAEVFWQTGVLSFNPSERVEANSSLLYTLIAIPGFTIFDREGVVYYYLPFVNVVFALITCLVLYQICLRSGMGKTWSRLAALFLAILPVTSFWAASAMETTLNTMLEVSFVAVVLMAIKTESGKTTKLLIALTLALLAVRPDGFLIPLCVIVFLAFGKGKWHLAGVVLTTLIIGFIALATWRYWYYGQPLPNTVYAKVTGSLSERFGAAYGNWHGTFVPSGLWVVLIPLWFKLTLEVVGVIQSSWGSAKTGKWRNPFTEITLLPWLATAMVGYWFLHSGDGYKERQLLTLFPLGVYVLMKFAHDSWNKGLKEGVSVVPVAAIALFMPITHFSALYDFQGTDLPVAPIMERDKNIVNALQKDYPGFQSIAADKLGFIGYLVGPRVRVDDMLGLADTHIAHQSHKYSSSGKFIPGHAKYDLDYTLQVRKPDVVYMIIYRASDLGHQYIAALNRPRLEAEGYELAYLSSYASYRCVDVRGDEEKLQHLLNAGGFNLAIYVKKDLSSREVLVASK